MQEIQLIEIKEEILAEIKGLADQIRENLSEKKVFMLNIMGSPGAGKTSLILKTIQHLTDHLRIAVVEADIDSMVDSQKVAALGIPVVQIQTGGFCHVDASMVEKALDTLPLDNLDLVLLENVGNLVCPAETDTGSHLNITLLSVPEGDDKPLKYPLIFTISDVLVVSKLDYLDLDDFDLERVKTRATAMNQNIKIFPLSCKTMVGIKDWIVCLEQEISIFRNP